MAQYSIDPNRGVVGPLRYLVSPLRPWGMARGNVRASWPNPLSCMDLPSFARAAAVIGLRSVRCADLDSTAEVSEQTVATLCSR